MLIAFCAISHLPMIAAEPAVFFSGLFGDATSSSVLVTGDAITDACRVGEMVAMTEPDFNLFRPRGDSRAA